MLKAAFNPAGGVRYHLRARRHRDREWAPFRAALAAWLAEWQPGTRALALVGPSGGHCLPAALVARFEHLICFEPDPTARPIFASRLRSLARESGAPVPEVEWIAEDAWIAPVVEGRGVPADLIAARGAALLFTNFLGQVSFLVPDDRWVAFRSAWRASLWPLLERVPWASFHDRVSGAIVPGLGAGVRSPKPLTDDEIVALYGDHQDGELLDHRTDELLPRAAGYAYFDWPIVPGRHHLVEGVLGNVAHSAPVPGGRRRGDHMATGGPTTTTTTTTTEDVLAGVDLKGMRALVTGAAGGLGLETARALAAHGAEVILAARDAAKADAALRTIREQVPGANVTGSELDLASLASVRASAARLVQQYDRLDLLINNAGVMACPLARTADGFELQFGTNHLGHFLFTGLLVPLLIAGAPARIVNLSSDGHMFSDVHWDDPNFARHDYEKWASYGQSKTANVLFSVELERRLGAAGVHAWAVHPGMIMTDLGRHLTKDDVAMLQSVTRGRGAKTAGAASGGGGGGGRGMPGFKTIPQGAATSVWAATAPELEGRGGGYLADCSEATRPNAWALDPVAAQRLWALSEKMVGETFAF